MRNVDNLRINDFTPLIGLVEYIDRCKKEGKVTETYSNRCLILSCYNLALTIGAGVGLAALIESFEKTIG